MTTTHERYAELVALAQLYLFQEHATGSWISTDSDTFQYFKTYALLNQQKRPLPPPPPAQPAIATPTPAPVHASAPMLPSAAAPTPTQAPTPSHTAMTLPAPPLEPPPSAPAPQDAPPETAKRAPKEASKGFALEPMTEAPPLDYTDLKKIFTEKFPAISWLETTPSDAAAKEQPKRRPAEIIILTYNESGKNLAFIHNLANAINLMAGPVDIIPAAHIERENRWEELLKSKELRLMITSYAGAQSLPGLMKNFKESAKQGLHHFGRIPICLLSDISIYLKEPQLKLPLWQSIQALLHHGK